MDLPRRPAARGHLPHLQHRLERHADAVLLRRGDRQPDRWALTDYVYSLGESDAPGYATLLVARPLDDDIDVSKGASLFDGAASAFAVIGQIMEPGRALRLPQNAVEVRAVYDSQRIAFEVRWHDMRADTSGRRTRRRSRCRSRKRARGPGGGGGGRRRDGRLGPACGSRDARAEVRLGGRWRLLGRDPGAAPRGRRPARSSRTYCTPASRPRHPRRHEAVLPLRRRVKPVDVWFLELASQKLRSSTAAARRA
mgnify:CR=1 FL=1